MKTNTHPRNLFRVIVGIFLMACLFGFLGVLATGCHSSIPDVAGSHLRYKRTAPDGSQIEVDVKSPREVRIGGVTVDLTNGLLVLTNYSAVPNEAALRARVDEAAQQREMWKDGLATGRELGALTVLGMTGRTPQPPGILSGPLSPDALAQIAALLRSTNTVPASTNALLR